MYAHIHNFRFTGNTPTQSHQLEVHAWTPGLKKKKKPSFTKDKSKLSTLFLYLGIKMFLKIFWKYPGIKVNWYVFKKISEQAIVIQWKNGKQTMDNVRITKSQWDSIFPPFWRARTALKSLPY